MHVCVPMCMNMNTQHTYTHMGEGRQVGGRVEREEGEMKKERKGGH